MYVKACKSMQVRAQHYRKHDILTPVSCLYTWPGFARPTSLKGRMGNG